MANCHEEVEKLQELINLVIENLYPLNFFGQGYYAMPEVTMQTQGPTGFRGLYYSVTASVSVTYETRAGAVLGRRVFFQACERCTVPIIAKYMALEELWALIQVAMDEVPSYYA